MRATRSNLLLHRGAQPKRGDEGQYPHQGDIARLARHPYSGRTTEHPGVRLLSVVRYPYLVYYSVDESTKEVHILRIRHSCPRSRPAPRIV
ncbi:MAG: type II toxin-antitoxin system RelE/ParE family toxin, partial [Sphingomonadales bacterium]|nr:type II toxin-antitoxin system RelE/ParE family toxin [Sphingomonadales bacterium]